MMNIWGGAKDIYFYNNIFYTELKNEKYEIGASNVVFSNNCFIGAHNETEPFDPYKITEDPKFVSKGSGEKGFTSTDGYKLKLDSPLINKGFSVPENGGRDFWGNGVYDGKTDVGAYEYSIVKNPGFEDDRKTGAEFSGWKNSYSTGEKNTASVATGGYYGKFKLVQTGKSDYSVKTEQTIDNLKTGIYDFSVVARSSGGQKTAKVVINGDETIEIPIPKTDEWITLVAKKIKVSNQNVKISIISEGSKGQWVNLDDVQLSMTDESKSLQNSGFDEYSANAENISGWQSLGTAAAKYDSTAYDGTGYALLQGTENSSINQKFTGVKDGIYDITVFSKTTGNLLNPKIVINSTTEITVPIVGSSYWKKTQIKAVNIKNSACTITISTDKSTDAKLYIDSIEISKRLTKEYYVKNPSFEKGTENWKDESSDKGVFKVTDSDSHSGSKKAVLAYSDAFIGRINQKFTNLPIDTYSVKIWAKYSGITGNAQVEISTGGKAPITEEFKKSSKYVQYILKDVIITNGVCSLSINIKGMAGNSLQIDDIEFLPIYHFSGKLTNMEFESDGLMSGKSTGWAVSGNTSAFAVESNGGAKRNTYYGLHFSNKAYQVDTFQNADNIPDGTYTLEAFVKSSGGQKEADMYVVSGKTYKKIAINKSDEWTKVKIEGIKVANGTARIGFKSNASPGQWIQFDVVEFYIMPTFLDPSFEDTAKFGKTTWSKWFNSNEMDPAIHLAKGDAHSGKQFVEFKFTQFVQGSIYQVFTDIPNGYYKLTCWVRSSGTDRRMDISVKENGSSAKVRSFKKTDVWKQYVLSNVAVYNEKMTSLIYAELNTGDWLQVDDIKIERMDRTIFDND
jgi:VCBS repeat-containing protein